MSYTPLNDLRVGFNDDFLDAFGNQRTAGPSFVADGQLTYDLQPLLYEQIVSGTGAVAYDSTERCANLTAPASGDGAAMQSYEHHRYQAGRAQEINITFNFNDDTGTSGLVYTAEYGDGANNGIGFRLNGTTKEFFIRSNTSLGDQAAAQSAWILDKLDGTGASGRTLDTTKIQILVIDLQALYVGRVRLGFNIDGGTVWAHEFDHANTVAYPYIQTANLPIRAGIANGTGGAITEEMNFICSSVLSRGGEVDASGYDFSASNTEIAVSSGARTHGISIQSKTLFNSIANRIGFKLKSINVVAETNPILWELCLGDAITGTTTFTDVNATYSGFSYNTAGATSSTPTLVIASGVVAAGNQSASGSVIQLDNRYPITLNAAGSLRSDNLGRLTLLLTGLGGAATAQATINWKELR